MYIGVRCKEVRGVRVVSVQRVGSTRGLHTES